MALEKETLTRITLPKLGESIVSATVVKWLKRVGDEVALDEPLLEVATDKVNSEIPSPVKGIVRRLLAQENETVDVNAPLLEIATSEKSYVQNEVIAERIEVEDQGEKKEFLSPAVLRLMALRGISPEQVKKIKGSGAGGRVTKNDILSSTHEKKPEPFRMAEDGTVEKLTPMRSAIAANMTRSHQEIPAATLMTEIDVTSLKRIVAEERGSFQKQHGVRLTLTGYFIEALRDACRAFPYLNATFLQNAIQIHAAVNIGIAMQVEQGLVVPVLKNAEKLPFAKIVQQLELLKQKATEKKLIQEDFAQGTVTLTNFGTGGIEIGIPIIPHGQTAILGVGSIQKKVVALDNGAIAVRDRVMLSLSFDHRVIDGIYGCDVLQHIKQRLENF